MKGDGTKQGKSCDVSAVAVARSRVIGTKFLFRHIVFITPAYAVVSELESPIYNYSN